MAKVNGISAVGRVEKIEFLEHWFFGGRGCLEGVDLGASGEKSDLSGAGQLVEEEGDIAGIAIGPSGEHSVHSKTEVAVFELGFKTGAHGGKSKVGHGTGRIDNIGT